MRRLGVDPGEKRVGVALSDEDGEFAFPHQTLQRTDDARVAECVAREVEMAGVREIVVGLPLRLDGSEGEAARRARALGAAIERRVQIPVVYWDERWTSAAAERGLREIAVRGKRRREILDQSAAALMLQAYLDAMRSKDTDEPSID